MIQSKPHFSPALIIFIFILSLGCSSGSGSGSSNASTGSPSQGFVTFKLDGIPWESSADHPDNKFDVEAITDHSTMVRIEAFAKDGSYLALSVFKQGGGISTGTYPITDTGMSGFFQYDPEAGGGFLTNGLPDNPGIITITSLTDEKVTGTFQFTMRDAGDPDQLKYVSEGNFDVTFFSLD